MTLLDESMKRLGEECSVNGKAAFFELAKNLLSGNRNEQCYAELAGRLGMSLGSFKVAVHRLRQRYGKLLRHEIAQTVASASEVDEEIRFLFTALSNEAG
jgi:hypothetical protein